MLLAAVLLLLAFFRARGFGADSSVTGDFVVDTSEPYEGMYAMGSSAGTVAETRTIDTTLCTDVRWFYWGKRGPENPDPGEFLEVEAWDGDRKIGDGTHRRGIVNVAEFERRFGVTKPEAAVT